MLSLPDTDLLRASQAGITALVERDLTTFWGSLDLGRPEAARDALLAYVPTLTGFYGEAAASVSADWYDDQRADAGIRPRFTAMPAEATPIERVEARVRFGAAHLFTDAPTGTLDSLLAAATKYSLQPGRDTIVRSTLQDPQASGWRRIARANGCDFCRMLEGRGGVYKEATAHFASHGHCNCAAAPSWDEHAPEVDVRAYVASQRLDTLRRQAAGEDVALSSRRRKDLERRGVTAQEDARRQLDAHRARVRGYVADFSGDH